VNDCQPIGILELKLLWMINAEVLTDDWFLETPGTRALSTFGQFGVFFAPEHPLGAPPKRTAAIGDEFRAINGPFCPISFGSFGNVPLSSEKICPGQWQAGHQ